jgi:hypothetical protein
MKQFAWVILTGLSFSQPLWAGHATGNGGNIVYCSGSQFSPDGYKILDYAIELKNGASPSDYRNPSNWAESATQIESVLATIDESAATSFQSFIASAPNDNSSLQVTHTSDREWLPDLDEAYVPLGSQYTTQVPASCLHDPHFPTLNGIQTFRVVTRIQSENEAVTTYFYDRQAVQDLLNSSALQYSLLMVHEWLWDYTSDSELNRRMNSALHQKTLSPSQKTELKSFFKQQTGHLDLPSPGATFLGGKWQECAMYHQAQNESYPTCDTWDGRAGGFAISSASLAAIDKQWMWLGTPTAGTIGPCLVETIGRVDQLANGPVVGYAFPATQYSAAFQWNDIFLVQSTGNHPRCLEFSDQLNSVGTTLWDSIDVIQDQQSGDIFWAYPGGLMPIRKTSF